MPIKGRLSKAYYDTLQSHCTYLCKEIDGQELTGYLFSKGIFSLDDVQEVEAHPSQGKRTRELVFKLLAATDNGYEQFILSLKDIYPHVASTLEEFTATLPVKGEDISVWAWFDELPPEKHKQVMDSRLASRISTCLGAGWEHLFYQLGISQVHVSQEKSRHQMNNSLAITALLIKWSQKETSAATLSALIKILKEVDCEVDMDGLQKKIGLT